MSYHVSLFWSNRFILICLWSCLSDMLWLTVGMFLSLLLSCSSGHGVWDLTWIVPAAGLSVELVLGESVLPQQSSLFCCSCELFMNMARFPGSVPLPRCALHRLLPIVPSWSTFTPRLRFLLCVPWPGQPLAEQCWGGHRTWAAPGPSDLSPRGPLQPRAVGGGKTPPDVKRSAQTSARLLLFDGFSPCPLLPSLQSRWTQQIAAMSSLPFAVTMKGSGENML